MKSFLKLKKNIKGLRVAFLAHKNINIKMGIQHVYMFY